MERIPDGRVLLKINQKGSSQDKKEKGVFKNHLLYTNMNIKQLFVGLWLLGTVLSCSRNKLEEKGFSVNPEADKEKIQQIHGIAIDTLAIKARPYSVLLTGHQQFRLTTIYKVNFNRRTETTFIGSNNYYYSYNDFGREQGNNWNYNFMPGLEIVYGYNLVNVSLFDNVSEKKKEFFDKPVLIKNLYFPSFSKDTLYGKPVLRNYYLVSVYDEDTNKDGFINVHDLRRFYYFDLKAENKTALLPENYHVISSEYDPGNDYMYVFAKLDQNDNGKGDDEEDIHIYWIDLKNPLKNGRQY